MVPAAISILFICIFRVFWVKAIFPNYTEILFLQDFSRWTSLLLVYPISWIMTGIAMIMSYIIIAKKTYN